MNLGLQFARKALYHCDTKTAHFSFALWREHLLNRSHVNERIVQYNILNSPHNEN